jgi:hypothetical protein
VISFEVPDFFCIFVIPKVRNGSQLKNGTNMTMTYLKAIILTALHDAANRVEEVIPKHKAVTKYVSVSGLSPMDIPKFMEDNKIPSDATFEGRPNSYDAYDDICLSWVEQGAKLTSLERDKLKAPEMERLAWVYILKKAAAEGYTLSKNKTKFAGISIFELYNNGEFETVVDFFAQHFKTTEI